MKKYYLLILLIFLLSILTCEIDHGLYPVSYKIKGKVLFGPGNPPDNTDRIEVFALKEFPPQDPQNFLYLSRSGALDYKLKSEVDYELLVSKTSYQLIGLVWKEKDFKWNLTGLLGIYTGNSNSILPDSVVITEEKPVVDSVNIYASWSRVSKNSHISGKITYQGEWPKDTSLLLLGIYSVKPNPNNELTYFAFENLDYTQPIFVDSSSYRLAVNSSIYNYIALFWVGKNISNLTDLVELGVYENSNQSGNPGQVDLSGGGDAENIDILVNFDNIEFP